MLLCVSSGGEPGSVDGGEFGVRSPTAFEFGEPRGLSSDAHSGPNKGGASLVPKLPEIVRGRHWLGVDDQVERLAGDRAFETPKNVFLRLPVLL